MKMIKILMSKFFIFFKFLKNYLKNACHSVANVFILFLNSIETIGKKTAWLISFLIFFSAIILAIMSAWKKTVYIYPTNLPEKVIKLGLSSENLTETTIRNIKKLTSLDNSDGSNYLNELKLRNNLGFDSGSCHNPFSSEKFATKTSRIINFHLQNKPQNIEVKFSDAVFPVNGLVDYLRSIFNRSNIVIKPSIILSETDGSYLVEVSALYNSNYSHNSNLIAKNLNQAEDYLTLLLLKYINPAIYASIMFESYPDDALEGMSLAAEHLQEYKEISSPSTLKGYLYLGSTKQSEELINLVKAESYFEEAIKKNEFDYEAKVGLLLVKRNRLARIDNSDYAKPYKKVMYDQAVVIADKLISDKKYLAEAYTLKAQLNDVTGRKKEAIKILKMALNNLPNSYLIQSTYINHLIDEKNFNEAHEYVKNINIKSPNDPYSPTFELVKLRLLLEEGEFISMQLTSELASKCTIGYLPELIWHTYRNEKNPLKKKQLQRILPSYFAEADRYGEKSLVFYIIWANFLSLIEHNDEALDKYKKALDYPGEHRWTWLNMAYIYNQQQKYKEAEEHAKKSISLGLTGAGVSNYLESIFWQKDYKRFIAEYRSYKNSISVDHKLNMKFLVFHGYAECNLGNKDEIKSVLEEIDSYEKKYIEFHLHDDIDNEMYRADIRNLKSCIN